MSLGEELKRYKGDRQQKALAAEWAEQWERKGTKGLSTSTVESMLSRCFKDDAEGVRFFFQDAARADLLLDVFGVPADQRHHLRALADQCISAGGGPAPRLVVDATGWDTGQNDHPDVLFAAIEEQILKGPLGPIVLVVTERQYRAIPRTIEDKTTRYRLERVPDAEAGRKKVAELATPGRAVVSPCLGFSFEQWIAADLDVRARHLTFEPTDGLTMFAERGSLPTPPVPTHDLTSLVKVTMIPDLHVRSACEARKMAFLVTTETGVAKLSREDARFERRIGWARKLGVTPTSTAFERAEHELARAGIKVTLSDKGQVMELLKRAESREVPPTALRVEQTIYLVNFGAAFPEALKDNEAVVRRDIERALPASILVLSVLENFTTDDALEDRDLKKAISRVKGANAAQLEHVRAGLLFSGAITPARAPSVANCIPVLRKIAEGNPPPARLRLRMKGFEVMGRRSSRRYSSEPFLVEQGAQVPTPPLSDLEVERSQAVEMVVLEERNSDWDRYNDEREEQTRYPRHLSLDPADYLNGNTWLDLFEGKKRASLDSGLICKREEVVIPPSLYQQADDELSHFWLALQRALRDPAIVRRHNGTFQLVLGSGLVAQVDIRSRANEAPTTPVLASLDVAVAGSRSMELSMELIELGRTGGSIVLGVRVPAGIHLAGAGIRVDFTFRSSPFFGALGAFGGAAAVTAEAEAQQAAADWDDDDD